MADVKMIVFGVVVILALILIVSWDAIANLFKEKPILQVPKFARGLTQFCSVDGNVDYFLFAKNGGDAGKLEAQSLYAVDYKTRTVDAQQRPTAVVAQDWNMARVVDEPNDFEVNVKKTIRKISQAACVGKLATFDFNRKYGKEFVINDRVYKVTMDKTADKPVTVKLIRGDVPARGLETTWEETAVAVFEVTWNKDKKTYSLPKSTFTESKDLNAELKTNIKVEMKAAENNNQLFEKIFGVMTDRIDLYENYFRARGVGVDIANDETATTLCSDKLSIFPTASGFEVMHTDDAGFTSLYPAVKNFPCKQDGICLNTGLGLEVTGKVDGSTVTATVNKAGKTDKNVQMRTGSCVMQGAKRAILKLLASSLPEDQCVGEEKYEYRKLLTSKPATSEKPTSVMAINPDKLVLRINSLDIHLYQVGAKTLFSKQVVATDCQKKTST